MIVLDVESSGLIAEKHSILSLGALDLDDPSNQFYEECRIWDGAEIEDEALAVNGFSREGCIDPAKQAEADLIRAFIAWACDKPKDRTLAAHNVSFDLSFVQAAAKRAGVDVPFGRRTVDVHTIAWMHMSQCGVPVPLGNNHSAISSKTVLLYCGLPDEASPHNALTGALWHAEVIARMVYTKKLLPDFDSFDIPWTTS